MNNSNENKTTVSVINDSPDSVFRLTDISMLIGETNFNSINQKLNYYVRNKKILSPRRGIYTKLAYSHQELANKIYTPSYVSLETVLSQSGIIQQADYAITSVSYLSRQINVADKIFSYHKFKGEVLVNPLGIKRIDSVNIAIPERAFLDLLYLGKQYDFNINTLNKRIINKLLPIYHSKKLSELVKKLFKND
ncbi:MAG: type IV toxin-antitoxin system AbiEi family antitoxin domain-containing protein [Prevotellaceae bacterium]|nr:type IV toxin-antitoxin system AbiEi family antitoxin domain-containing protein [Prevotellaceae bacterium]